MLYNRFALYVDRSFLAVQLAVPDKMPDEVAAQFWVSPRAA